MKNKPTSQFSPPKSILEMFTEDPAIAAFLKACQWLGKACKWLWRKALNLGWHAERVIRLAIWFSFLGYLAPDLREQLPSFYVLVNQVTAIIEQLAQLVWQSLQAFL